MQFIEIAGRTYALRFTARSLLRTQSQLDMPFRQLFTSGEKGARQLLYCALCDAYPAVTQKKANALFDALKEDLPLLYDTLAAAYDESGFPREGITQAAFDRLLDSAARAGMYCSDRLLDLDYRQITRELDAHLARARIAPAAPMTDQQMLCVLQSIERRNHRADP